MFSAPLDNFLPFSSNSNCHLKTLSDWKNLKFVVWERVKRDLTDLYQDYLIALESYSCGENLENTPFAAFVEDSATVSSMRHFENHVS